MLSICFSNKEYQDGMYWKIFLNKVQFSLLRQDYHNNSVLCFYD